MAVDRCTIKSGTLLCYRSGTVCFCCVVISQLCSFLTSFSCIALMRPPLFARAPLKCENQIFLRRHLGNHPRSAHCMFLPISFVGDVGKNNPAPGGPFETAPRLSLCMSCLLISSERDPTCAGARGGTLSIFNTRPRFFFCWRIFRGAITQNSLELDLQVDEL